MSILLRAIRFSALAFTLALSPVYSSLANQVDFDSLYQDAVSRLERGDHASAIPLFERAILLNPLSAGARLDLAQAYCESGNRSKAEEILRDVRRTFSLNVDAFMKAEQRVLINCQHAFRLGLMVSVGVGFASNANIAPSSPFLEIGSPADPIRLELSQAFRPQSDSFTDVHFQGVLVRSDDDAHRLLMSYNTKQFQRVTGFNFDSIVAGYAGRTKLISVIELQWAFVGSQSTLGGNPFEKSARVATDIWLDGFQQGSSRVGQRFGVGVSVLESRYAQDAQFDATRYEVGLKYEQPISPRLEIGVTLGGIQDLAVNSRPGGNRDGAFLTAEGLFRSRFGETTVLLSAQRLRDQAPYNDLFFPGVKRDARRFFATARQEVSMDTFGGFPQGLHLFLQGSLDRSDDNISIFSVKNHILISGILFRF